MKTVNSLIYFLLMAAISSHGQKQNKNQFENLVPARGYYKSLAAIDPKPKSANEEVDKSKFPFDQASAEQKLSLSPFYLKNITVSDFKIPEPPANSSKQTRAELNYLLTLQEQRTELDIESSLLMAGIFFNPRTTPEDSSYNQYRQNLFHVGRGIGSWFNPKNLAVTADLMANVWRDASYFIWSLKYKHLRIRPYVLDSAIKNLEDTNWAAYPSGHAGNSYVSAFVYQELAPEFADIFLKDAYDMAHSREIIGVHYPSDSEASRIFARQFVNKLFLNEKFLRDFKLVKKEWAERAKENFVKPYVSPSSDKIQKAPSCAKTCK